MTAASSSRATRYSTVPRSAARDIVNDLLLRSKRFHCSVSGVAEYDVTDLRARLRDARRGGRDISLTAVLLKATATLMAEQPHLNRHQFTGLWGTRKVVEFEDIHCTVVVARRARVGDTAVAGKGTRDVDEILLPLLVTDTNTKSMEQLEAEIRAARTTPLEQLPAWTQLQRAKVTQPGCTCGKSRQRQKHPSARSNRTGRFQLTSEREDRSEYDEDHNSAD